MQQWQWRDGQYDNQNDLSLLNEAGYNNIGDCIVEDED